MSDQFMCASCMTISQIVLVFSTRCAQIFSKSSRVSSILMLLPLCEWTIVVRGRLESWIFPASARLWSSW